MIKTDVDVRRLLALASRKKKIGVHSGLRSQIRRSHDEETATKMLLYACENDWSQLDGRRREHERFMRYMSGDQWSDYVQDPDNPGKVIQEKVLISRTGITPITNNIIQGFVRNILGQMLSNKYQTMVNARRDEDAEIADMLTNTVQACLDINQNSTLDINHLIGLLSMGISWGKITYATWDERNDTDGRIYFVNQNRIAWNQDCEDPRLFDLRRICELHDYTLNELLANFAKTPADEQVLRELYISTNDKTGQRETMNREAAETLGTLDFWSNTADVNKCRVIEVWQKLGRWVLWLHDRATVELPMEFIEDFNTVERAANAENDRRVAQAEAVGLTREEVNDSLIEYERHYEEYWQVKYLTPHGVCLLEMETPYKHQQHPYVFAAMPVVDGMPKPLLSDLVEMQRNINRQRTMLDAIIAGSAKNTLFIDEEQLKGHDIQEYAEEIQKINGVISYKSKPGTPLPQFLSRNSTNIGIWDILNFDMQQAKEISGLTGALQGQVAKAGTPSSLYMQQAQNAMLNFVLLFDRFNEFCTKRDEKLLNVLIQYYDKRRHVAVAGRSYASVASEYIPDKAQAIAGNYSLVTSQSADSPVFRQRIDDYLMDLVRMGLPLELFLENSTLPFTKKVLTQLKTLKQQQQQGQPMDGGIMEQVQGEAAQNSNPQAAQMLQRMFGTQSEQTPVTTS